MSNRNECIVNTAPEPPTKQEPDVLPPDSPTPGRPKPGDPPGQPRPGDPPRTDPQPNKPDPVQPKAVAVLLLICLAASFASAQPGKEAIDDNDILEAVETDLRLDDVVSADLLNVNVDAGVVTLSGKAFTLLGKRRGVRLVGSLKGVRAVVDDVEVMSAGRSDKQIFADVQAALRDDAVADADEVQVTVGQGRVTLGGTVDSYPEKRMAEATVAGVRGVAEIDNQITILAPTVRPDKEIKPEILRRFELNPYLAEGLIDVRVKSGVVTLSGVVGSVNEKLLASWLGWVPGVQQVDASSLEVNWWLDRERRRDKFTVLRNDIELQRAVEDGLLYDPRIRGMKVQVRVRRGAVSLLGEVSSLSAKHAAEDDALNTLGVRRVFNHLKVKDPDWPGDLATTKRTREALARDAHLADFDLKASSHFGKMYLSGQVNTHFEKERADTVAANVPGVLQVVNRITVDSPWVPKPDDEIKEDVERRLRWSPLLDPDQIRVSVRGGTVTLAGIVDTWHERKAVGRHAYRSGARDVINNINVRIERNTPLGLKATLIPRRVNYELDPRLSGEAFRQHLVRSSPVRDPRELPPPPQVDLILKLSNEGHRPVDVRLGHDKCEIEMSLTGSGAAHVLLAPAFTADFHHGSVVSLATGEDLEIPIRSLQFGFRNASQRWYWTEAGTYMLQVTYTWPVDVTGIDMQAVAASPVELNVQLGEKQEVTK